MFSQPPEAAAPAQPEDPNEPAAAPEDDAAAKAAATVAFYQLRAAEATAADAARGIEGRGYTTTARPEQLDQLRAALADWLARPDTSHARERIAQLRHAAAAARLEIARAAASLHAELIAVLQAAGELPAAEASA